jgi:hypothetical protein
VPRHDRAAIPYIEHPELIAQRIGRYADLLGRERVMAGCRLRLLGPRGQQQPRSRNRLGQARRAGRRRGDRQQALLRKSRIRGRGGMVDAGDLKSPELCSCGFESHPALCRGHRLVRPDARRGAAERCQRAGYGERRRIDLRPADRQGDGPVRYRHDVGQFKGGNPARAGGGPCAGLCRRSGLGSPCA